MRAKGTYTTTVPTHARLLMQAKDTEQYPRDSLLLLCKVAGIECE